MGSVWKMDSLRGEGVDTVDIGEKKVVEISAEIREKIRRKFEGLEPSAVIDGLILLAEKHQEVPS